MIVEKKAILKALGIQSDIGLAPEDMGKELEVTFFPYNEHRLSYNVLDFAEKLKTELVKANVKITPFEDTLVRLPLIKAIKWFFYAISGIVLSPLEKILKKRFFPKKRPTITTIIRAVKNKKIKKGVTIIALGDNKAGQLPIDRVMSFRDNQIVTIIDMPLSIEEEIDFESHFNKAMNLFAHYMTHIIFGVSEKKVLAYNLNAAHPLFEKSELPEYAKKFIIPKMSAPIQPLRLSELVINKISINEIRKKYRHQLEDLIEGSQMFRKTKLFLPRKLVESLPFRDNFYIWAGNIFLDHRTGMSYGYLAKQLPITREKSVPWEEFTALHPECRENDGWIDVNGQLYLIVNLGQKYVLKVPAVSVLTQRSGSDKTDFRPERDLIVMKLENGKIILEIPDSVRNVNDYRPSYDTRVILAHALGNAIIANIMMHRGLENDFVRQMINEGMGICHWHGYFNENKIPAGWQVYGEDNPHVSCSTPQSAYYALAGKLKAFSQATVEYRGDIHIEPHHGINIIYPSIIKLAQMILNGREITELGNKYFKS